MQTLHNIELLSSKVLMSTSRAHVFISECICLSTVTERKINISNTILLQIFHLPKIKFPNLRNYIARRLGTRLLSREHMRERRLKQSVLKTEVSSESKR